MMKVDETEPTREYVEDKVAQVQAACDLFGGGGVTAIVEQVRADGFPALADMLATEVVQAWRAAR